MTEQPDRKIEMYSDFAHKIGLELLLNQLY